jgi:hypothetical protein
MREKKISGSFDEGLKTRAIVALKNGLKTNSNDSFRKVLWKFNKNSKIFKV